MNSVIHTHKHHAGIATIGCSIELHLLSLFREVVPSKPVATQIQTGGGLDLLQRYGRYSRNMLCIDAWKKPVSKSLARVLVSCDQIHLSRHKSFYDKHTQPTFISESN